MTHWWLVKLNLVMYYSPQIEAPPELLEIWPDLLPRRAHSFCTGPQFSITLPKSELNPSNLKFDLTFDITWPWWASSSIGVLRSPSVQRRPPQMWALSEQPEIWPDLWPLMTFWNNRTLPPTTVPSFIPIGRKGAKRIAGHTHRHTSLFYYTRAPVGAIAVMQLQRMLHCLP